MDKIPDLRLPASRPRGSSLLRLPPSLALIKEKDSIAAAVCRPSLFRPKLEAIFRRSLDRNLAETLTALHKDCLENGWAAAWAGRVKICLPANEAIFQDFHLPPSSLRKAKKTVPLLLDSEIPVNAEQYQRRTIFTRRDGIDALVTLLPDSIMKKWSDALQDFDFSAMDIVIMPWPLLNILPPRKAPCLLLCLNASGSLVCALNSRGRPLRFCPLLPCANTEEGAQSMLRQAGLLMAALPFHPESVLVFGAADNAAIKKAAHDIFNLPCHILGENGNSGRDMEECSLDMLAKALFTPRILKGAALPSFSLKFKREKAPRFSWLLPAGICIALLGGFDLLALLNILDNSRKTEALRSLMAEELRESMENLPPNASLGRLTAILDSRLREAENNTAGEASHPLIAMLENIHKACPENLKIHLQRLSYDDRHVRLTGTAESYKDIEDLKNGTENLPGIAGSRIVNAASSRDKNRQFVEFELDLSRDRQ